MRTVSAAGKGFGTPAQKPAKERVAVKQSDKKASKASTKSVCLYVLQ